MTRKRANPFPHTNWMRDRHGGERCILRVPGRKGITLKGWNNRLRAEASPLFAAQYRDAMAGVEPVEKKGLSVPRNGTVAGLRVLTYKHAYFTSKRPTTQRSLSSFVGKLIKSGPDYFPVIFLGGFGRGGGAGGGPGGFGMLAIDMNRFQLRNGSLPRPSPTTVRPKCHRGRERLGMV